MYSTVLFDVGTTLLGVRGGPATQYAETALAVTGFDRPAPDYQAAFDDVMREHGAAIFRHDPAHPVDDDLEHDRWRQFSRLVLERLGLHESGQRRVAEALIGVFAEPDVWAPFPDTWPMLEAIHERGDVRIGIVSNWSRNLRRVLAAHDLIEPFAVIVGSCDEGVEKPNPAIFHLALAALDANAGETIYVGDSLEADVAGAEATGMTPLLIDRRGRHADHPCRIASLLEVVERL